MVPMPRPPAVELAVRFDPRQTAMGLAVVAMALAAAGTAGPILTHLTGHDSAYGLIAFFSLRRESNPPAFFSGLLLLGAALLLALRASLARQRREGYLWRWRILAAGFALMALDEAASLHEMLNRPTRAFLGPSATGWLRYAWVAPATAIVAPVLVSFSGFARALPRPTGRRFVTAALVYLSGALLLEAASARYATDHGEGALGYDLLVSVEESLEMGGVILFIYALLDHLRAEGARIRVGFGQVADSADSPLPHVRLVDAAGQAVAAGRGPRETPRPTAWSG